MPASIICSLTTLDAMPDQALPALARSALILFACEGGSALPMGMHLVADIGSHFLSQPKALKVQLHRVSLHTDIATSLARLSYASSTSRLCRRSCQASACLWA